MPPLDTVILGDNVTTMREFSDACIDLVVTSPPYDNLRTYGGHTWDFNGVATELTRVLKPGGVIVWVVGDATVKGSETLTSMRQAIHFKDACGLNVHDTMIYASDKPPLTHNRYEQCWEYMFIFSKGRPKTWNPVLRKADNPGGKSGKFVQRRDGGFEAAHTDTRTPENVLERNIWSYTTGHERNGHPAVYPLALARDHILSWSNPGDVVLDPFAGSGTTCVASRENARHYVGIEVNLTYVEICNRRLGIAALNPT